MRAAKNPYVLAHWTTGFQTFFLPCIDWKPTKRVLMSDVKETRREPEGKESWNKERRNVLCLKQVFCRYAIKQQKLHLQELVVQYKDGYYEALFMGSSM